MAPIIEQYITVAREEGKLIKNWVSLPNTSHFPNERSPSITLYHQLIEEKPDTFREVADDKGSSCYVK
jgi:hypothetical protein